MNDKERERVLETLRAVLDCVDREAVRERLAGIPRTKAASFSKVGWARLDARLREAREAVETIMGDG